MSKYQHIFFDLDHTLWDFKGNSRRTLSELFSHFDIQSKTDNTVDDFLDVYERYNQKMWNDYCSGRMSLRYPAYRKISAKLQTYWRS